MTDEPAMGDDFAVADGVGVSVGVSVRVGVEVGVDVIVDVELAVGVGDFIADRRSLAKAMYSAGTSSTGSARSAS